MRFSTYDKQNLADVVNEGTIAVIDGFDGKIALDMYDLKHPGSASGAWVTMTVQEAIDLRNRLNTILDERLV